MYVPPTDRHQIVRDHIVAVYEEQKVSRIARQNADELMETVLRSNTLPTLQINNTKKLGSDEVFVLEESNSNWVSILSRQWELARLGEHPLAQALSQLYTVLSVAYIEGEYVEYSRYESGQVAQMTLIGEKNPSHIEPGLPMLDHLWFRGKEANDLTWFKSKDDKAYDEMFKKWRESPDRFIAYIGLSAQGHRSAFEAAPLSDFSPDQYIVFRKEGHYE